MNVVITGSTRGIGFALAERFLENKHNVLINGTSEQSITRALEKLKNYKSQIVPLVKKVSEKDFADLAFTLINQRFGTVDIWINNAGMAQSYKLAYELDDDEINEVITTNLINVIQLTAKVYRWMLQQNTGKIFNMEGFGSDGRKMSFMALYGTSKSALSYFTRSFAKEIGGDKIQVGRLSPGMVVTEFINKALESAPAKEQERIKKAYNMLGNLPKNVSQFLYSGINKSTKNNDKINYLSSFKIMKKIVIYQFQKNNYFADNE